MISRSFFFRTAILCVLSLSAIQGHAQKIGLKTNILYWAATTPNIGLEIAMSPQTTLEINGAYNPWTFADDKKMRFWLVQPEARYWFCERFEGHFIGLHLHGAQYFGGFDQTRYDGYLAGGGFTYGYDWILSPHWNLEAVIGVGYARLWYDKSPRIHCEKCRTSEHRNYFGPTKIGISLVYLF
ncbi:DUF3575 domain-containing protein [uncultured Alistipes sp.]|uniref:DUF3575 domain-containing protein n=1 Tax=uncultured Alistipes sp. TaxID=538949 RepID=UPI0026317221|nr:DUF3575 domain-containing protein [uncultured Alistipes sp.]